MNVNQRNRRIRKGYRAVKLDSLMDFNPLNLSGILLNGWYNQARSEGLYGPSPAFSWAGSKRVAMNPSDILRMITGLKTASPAMGATAAQFNDLQNAEGAYFGINTPTSTTVTVAAGNTKRIQYLYDLGSTVNTLNAALDDSMAKYSSNIIRLDFHSTVPSSVQPWIVWMENGESPTASDYNGDDVYSATEAALGAQDHVTEWGPLVVGNYIRDAGSPLWTGSIEWELAPILNAYSAHSCKKELEEENPLALFLGVTVCSQPAGTTIYRQSTYQYKSVKKSRNIMSL